MNYHKSKCSAASLNMYKTTNNDINDIYMINYKYVNSFTITIYRSTPIDKCRNRSTQETKATTNLNIKNLTYGL